MTVTVMAHRRRALRGASKSGVWAASAVAVVISGPLWREGRRRHRMSGRASRRSCQSEGARSIHAFRLSFADLARRGLVEHTVVIVTSEHGMEFGKNGQGSPTARIRPR